MGSLFWKNVWQTSLSRILESQELLRRVLPFAVEFPESIEIIHVRRWALRRKLIGVAGDRRFICHLSVEGNFLENLDLCHRAALANEIPVSSIIASGTVRYRTVLVHFLILDWLSGQAYEQGRPYEIQTLEKLGQLLARMHTIEGKETKKWSSIRRDRTRQYYLLKKVYSTLLDEELLFTNEQTLSRFKAARGWIESKCLLLTDERYHRLTHGDLSRKNILMHEKGFGLIDTDQMSFDYPLVEFVRFLVRLGHPEKQKSFLSGYESQIDDLLWGLWCDNLQTMAGIGFLWRTHSSLKWLRRPENANEKRKLAVNPRILLDTFLALIESRQNKHVTWDEIACVFSDVKFRHNNCE